MARCASQVIKDNGWSSKIHLVSKRSTDLTVGVGCDLERRANILVTEVFDTELIGEGAVATLNHARLELLEVMSSFHREVTSIEYVEISHRAIYILQISCP